MSKTIDDILEVLDFVYDGYTRSEQGTIKDFRKRADNDIASKQGVWRTTIQNAYRRQLEPDISGVDAFDALIESWLDKGSLDLRNILIRHAKDAQDRKNIDELFGWPDEQQKTETLYQQMRRLTEVEKDIVSDQPDFNPDSLEDEHQIVAREIVQRRGQHKFRQQLLENYEQVCSVTGTSTVDVLEAAHIAPYCGEASNHPTNGLLLRADIHVLFDYGLLAINEAEYTVLVSNELDDPL